MFFLIRCAFWLTVVFVTIFSQEPGRNTFAAPGYSQAQTAQRARIDALARAWTGAATLLIKREVAAECDNCLAKLAELSDRAYLASAAVKHAAEPRARRFAPLPPRRPVFAALKRLEKSARSEYVIEYSSRS